MSRPPLSQQIINPRSLRLGNQSGSKKIRAVHPDKENQSETREIEYKSQNLLIRFNNSTEECPNEGYEKVGIENHSKFISTNYMSTSHYGLSISKWNSDQVGSQDEITDKDMSTQKITLDVKGQIRGVSSQSSLQDETSIGHNGNNGFNQPNSKLDHSMACSIVCDAKNEGDDQLAEGTKSVNISICGAGETQRIEDPHIEFNQADLTKQQKLQERKNKVPKWKKLKSVFHSLVLFKREDVKQIDNAKAISNEVNQFELRKQSKVSFVQNNNSKDTATQEALDLIRRIKIFCQAASIGSPQDIIKMKEILQNDPKKYMREPEDPQHILNLSNIQAAKNGNIDVVKLLIESRANHQLKSKVGPNEIFEETALEVAVRWGHAAVVDYLLENCKFDPKIYVKAASVASNVLIKQKLLVYIKKNKERLSFSFFSCSKYK